MTTNAFRAPNGSSQMSIECTKALNVTRRTENDAPLPMSTQFTGVLGELR